VVDKENLKLVYSVPLQKFCKPPKGDKRMKKLRPVLIATALLLVLVLPASAECGDVSCPVAATPLPAPIATEGEIPNDLIGVAISIIQNILSLS
jgi:hypothetical protein